MPAPPFAVTVVLEMIKLAPSPIGAIPIWLESVLILSRDPLPVMRTVLFIKAKALLWLSIWFFPMRLIVSVSEPNSLIKSITISFLVVRFAFSSVRVLVSASYRTAPSLPTP